MVDEFPFRAKLNIEVDLEIGPPEAVTAAAIEGTSRYDFGSEIAAAEERNLLASDFGAAVMELVDTGLLEGDTGLIQVRGSVMGFLEQPHPQGSRDEAAAEEQTLPPSLRVHPSPEDEYSETGIARNSVNLHGIDWVFEDIVPEESEPRPSTAERAKLMRETALIRGLLWHASVTVVDRLFEDLRELARPDAGAGAWHDTWVLSQLPPMFGHRYGVLFAQKFLVAAVEVTARLAGGWSTLPTVAHELALRIILNEAESVQEEIAFSLRSDWRAQLEEVLFRDLDHELLYEPDMDGIGEYAAAQLGMTPMDFASWFVPFANAEQPAPYATDSSRIGRLDDD
ncbi:hypothetical protein ACFC1I_12765 [Microbacterium sp. NPDC056044]|uniref:hypothetical protein n=1 Tax=Microbacterium sp. NPDC056044 TaxID=3345690 RepID=UPI0035D6733F